MGTKFVEKSNAGRCLVLLFAVLFVPAVLFAQNLNIISEDQVGGIIKFMSSDDIQGRKVFTEDIVKVENYIAEQFKNAGLKSFKQFPDFKESFESVGRDSMRRALANVIGYLEGTDPKFKDEFVMFSAHHDHLGIRRGAAPDSIYNGADDDASGVAAVISLANYFVKTGGAKRSLLFVTFTGEESGGYGSRQLAKELPAPSEKMIAMINFEMIGLVSKFGKNSAYITGFDRSDLGAIMQEALKGSEYMVHPDPYPSQNLFMRSDNAKFVPLGIPAHSFSTVDMDATQKTYHTVKDEYETLDIQNAVNIIRGIALGIKPVVNGDKTPTRITVIR
jgi:Zn-dependent M28 family amino/carboxypeptidase